MEVPLFGDDPVEMGVTDANRAEILDRLRADPVYPPLFRQSFPEEAEPLTMAAVIKAIAAFQRSIVSVDSRYDRYLQGKASLGEADGFVPLLDAGVAPGGPYLVLPLLTGGTLRDRMKRAPPAIEEAARLVARLAGALGVAHRRGIDK